MHFGRSTIGVLGFYSVDPEDWKYQSGNPQYVSKYVGPSWKICIPNDGKQHIVTLRMYREKYDHGSNAHIDHGSHSVGVQCTPCSYQIETQVYRCESPYVWPWLPDKCCVDIFLVQSGGSDDRGCISGWELFRKIPGSPEYESMGKEFRGSTQGDAFFGPGSWIVNTPTYSSLGNRMLVKRLVVSIGVWEGYIILYDTCGVGRKIDLSILCRFDMNERAIQGGIQ